MKAARPTKMAHSTRKGNYVIRVDDYISWRVLCPDSAVDIGTYVTIRKYTYIKQSLPIR